MRYIFCLLLLALAITLKAERAYIDNNKFFFEEEGYEVFDVKGQPNTWYLEHRSLKISSESEQKSEDGENSACDDWIIFGPYDFTLAQNIEFSYLLNVNYGSNAVALLASTDFPGYENEFEMPGVWKTILAAESINPEEEVDTNVSATLDDYEGEKEVYLALRFVRPVSADVFRNQIKEISLTREVHEKVEEIAAIDIIRSNQGTDFFNVPGTPGDNSTWSIRTGYAKASRGNDAWLVMRSVNLITSGDAFFSFESQLASGTSGPEGLEIKIAREQFSAESEVGQLEWEDYSRGRVDHRAYPTDFFESGKLDLSQYLGSWVTIAFRYINPKGEQYSIKNIKMFHLPDIEPPVLLTNEIARLVHNKIFLNLKANEAATINWGIYKSSDAAPGVDDILSGTNAVSFGEYSYANANTDSVFSFPGINASTSYKLFFVLKDINDNRSQIHNVAFSTPAEDLNPPVLLNAKFNDTNNFSSVFSFKTNKPCRYYYIIQKSDENAPDLAQILNEGTPGLIEDEEHQLGFYNFEKNTSYTIYWVGTDYADNQSGILNYEVQTTNLDIEPPVINKFEINAVHDFSASFYVNADEAGTGYYLIQDKDKPAPSAEIIAGGGSGEVFGSFNYNSINAVLDLNITGLRNNTPYIIYITIVDDKDNMSFVRFNEFKTTANEVPVIESNVKSRIVISREERYVLTKDMFNIVNGADASEYEVLVLSGENYTGSANAFTAADNYTGGIKVPVCLQKGEIRSNTVDFNFIVDYETVRDSLAGLRRNMSGMNLVSEIEDDPTQHALLALQNDGSFFGGELPNSPTYTEYMNKVLGGRLLNIALDYDSERFRSRKATEVRNKLYKAVEYWIDNKPNYDPELAPLKWPKYMGAIMLSIYDDMIEEYQFTPSKRAQISSLIDKVDAFNEWCWTGVDSLKLFQPYKGNNISGRVWGATALAAVTENVELTFEVYDTLVANLAFQYNGFNEHPAGLMPDGSYCMNNKSGSLWNWYPHGFEWISDVLEYAEVTRRTNWRLPDESFDLMATGVTDGMRWLHWNDFIPHNLSGMYYSDNGSKRQKNSVLRMMNQIRFESLVNNADIDKNEEIFEEYEVIREEYSTYDSTKYFWNANATIHSRGNFIATLFTPSKRTGGFETGVDTIYGLKNYFLGDGAVFLYNEESSYNRRHLLDHTRLPGTTVERRNIILPYNLGAANGRSNNEFAGGVSNGRQAVSSFFYNRAQSKANATGLKSYFFFDGGYVALGNGINKVTNNQLYSLATTLDQEIMEDKITYSVETGKLETIEPSSVNKLYNFNLKNKGWFYFKNKTFYIIPEENESVNVKVDVRESIESWDIFNGEVRLLDDIDDIRYDTAFVATMEINHGKNISNEKYAYVAFAGLAPDKIDNYLSKDPIKILANDDSIQAVHFVNEEMFGIVFVQPGEISLSEEITISANKPSVLLVKQNEDGLIEVWASDPYQRENILEVGIVKREKNKLPVTINRILVLPGGINKGAAVYTNTGNIWEEVVSSEASANINVAAKKEFAGNLDFKVFPNPVNKDQLLNIQFKTESGEDLTLRIINVNGERMYKRKYQSFEGAMYTQIDCSGLKSGLYFAIIQSKNKVRNVRFLVR